MTTKDPRVDSYIEEAAEFARPILKHLRKLIHQGCPAAVETIKWGSPFFEYHGVLCGLAAFKAHCSLFFWRDIDVSQWLPKTNTAGAGMGQFGKLTSLADLPKDSVILACIRAAVEQRDSPKSKPMRARQPAKELPVPPDLKKALSANSKAPPHLRVLHRVIAASTSIGSPRRSAPKRVSAGSRRRSNG